MLNAKAEQMGHVLFILINIISGSSKDTGNGKQPKIEAKKERMIIEGKESALTK
jgi:hypothetical protein